MPKIEVGPPPYTEAKPVVDNLHGVDVEDSYRWLEDDNSEETRAWIDAQNEYTDSILSQIDGQDELRSVVSELMSTDSYSAPYHVGDRYFYSLRRVGEPQSRIYVREGLHGQESLLLDPTSMSEDNTVSISIAAISKDGSLLAYHKRDGGMDETEVHVIAIGSQEQLPAYVPAGRISNVRFSANNETLYYVLISPDGPRFMRMNLADESSQATTLWGKELSNESFLDIRYARGSNSVLGMVRSGTSGVTDLYLGSLSDGSTWQKIFSDGKSGAFARIVDDKIVILSDENAPNGRVFITDISQPGREFWQEIVPEENNAVLNSFSAIGGHLVLNYLKDVKYINRVHRLDGTFVREIAPKVGGYISSGRGTWDNPEAFTSYTSYLIPLSVYRFDVSTGELGPWEEIGSPVNPDEFLLQQVKYPSKDGTKIPLWILARRDVQLDGSNPAILLGYGGFGFTLTPGFMPLAAAWVLNGGVFAVANIRGGGEFGTGWHEAGMLANKQNVFDDFIAAGEYLIEAGYTSPSHLGIRGGSNGGLLIGAVITQRPDLFRAALSAVPILDMLRYQHFLGGKWWVGEYGSSDDSEQFEYLLKYSPYHNVKQGTVYPATMFVTSDSDTLVAPLHARKMTALMQAMQSGDAPILLRYHTKAGHSAGMPLDHQINEIIEELSFFRWQLTMPDAGEK